MIERRKLWFAVAETVRFSAGDWVWTKCLRIPLRSPEGSRRRPPSSAFISIRRDESLHFAEASGRREDPSSCDTADANPDGPAACAGVVLRTKTCPSLPDFCR